MCSTIRLLWFEPRWCAGCPPRFESFWLKFSKYFHSEIETVEKYWYAQVSYWWMFYYCSIFQGRKLSLTVLRMFQYIRAVWNSAALSMHLQFRAALGWGISGHNSKGMGLVRKGELVRKKSLKHSRGTFSTSALVYFSFPGREKRGNCLD